MRGDVVSPDPRFAYRKYGSEQDASFQVIILGSSGGPREDNLTGLLVRATHTQWRKNSVIAVDAGAHLASVIRILEQDMPTASEKLPPTGYSKVLDHGPFAGVSFPHISAKANALHIFRELLNAFLITHAHLDHLGGMATNTPALEYGREAKAIVALPPTIEAIKSHIFNDAIWPNLSDEGHGVGFVTYRRLVEGGNSRLGVGAARGYVTVCEGLATKCWSVSHGKCHRRHHSVSHQRGDSLGFPGSDAHNFATRRLSRISDDHGYLAALASQNARDPGVVATLPPATPSAVQSMDKDHLFESVPSSAFFIRNDETGNELLIFGDIEPDSISMSPKNHIVWEDAAPKVANGMLKAIFIECSFDDSVRDADLYGHLCPRQLIAELTFLANCVSAVEMHHEKGALADSTLKRLHMSQPPSGAEDRKKRKRVGNGDIEETPEPPASLESRIPRYLPNGHVSQRCVTSPRRKISHAVAAPDGFVSERPATPSRRAHFVPQDHPPTSRIRSRSDPLASEGRQAKLREPLEGLTVHIIHVKDTLADGPSPGQIILAQLNEYAEEVKLGCAFDVTSCGESIWI